VWIWLPVTAWSLPATVLAVAVGFAAVLPRREPVSVPVPWLDLFLLAAALSLTALRSSTDLAELRTE
jgi:hypothetical protein